MSKNKMDEEFSAYLSGGKLYGDDFSTEQLRAWYEAEAEGYSGLVNDTSKSYSYVYHELNKFHGFRHVKLPKQCKALGVGSAFCEEFDPILSNLAHITALDPSEHFSVKKRGDVPVSQVRPALDGRMPFANNEFDVVTCFGVLHHVANVSFVMEECHRVLKPGGVMFCREPIVTMGDWRKPRHGLTKNERGIPFHLFVQIVERSGFEVHRQTLFDFPPLGRLLNTLGYSAFAHKTTTFLDFLFSRIFSFNKRYHRENMLEKFGPASLYMVLRKKHSLKAR